MDAVAIVEALAEPAGRADPYPLYARARQLGPVARVWPDVVLVSGYDEVNRVLRDPAFGVVDGDVRPGAAEPASVRVLGSSVLRTNPPRHAAMRAPIASVFTPRRVRELEPAITATVDRLLDGIAAEFARDGWTDFMDRFAFRLPVNVICALLGVPEQDRYRFRGLVGELTALLEFMPGDLTAADLAAAELEDYFRRLAAERRIRPRADLVTALVGLTGTEPGLDEGELLGNLVLLLVAGFETTTNLLGNGLALLFRHPHVAAALRAGALPVADFVEEVLRFDAPVQMTSRLARTAGLSVGGFELPRGGEALLLIAAANRDPARHPDPDRFDPWRAEIAPLTFGAGPHYCLGAMLARREAALAFDRLLRRFPGLAPAPGREAVRNSRLLLRGYTDLPVRC
jgi:cytochrome P450